MCVFDTITQHIQEYHDFIPYNSSSDFGIATRGVMKTVNGEDLIVVNFIQLQKFWLIVHSKGESTPAVRVSSKFKYGNQTEIKVVEKIYDMEPTVDKNLIMIAGSTKKTPNGMSEGVLAVVEFSEDLKIISEQLMDEHKVQACTVIKRIPSSNFCVVGTYKDLCIFEFRNNTFYLSRRIRQIHSSKYKNVRFRCFRRSNNSQKLRIFCLYKGRVYSCHKDQRVTVSFKI